MSDPSCRESVRARTEENGDNVDQTMGGVWWEDGEMQNRREKRRGGGIVYKESVTSAAADK